MSKRHRQGLHGRRAEQLRIALERLLLRGLHYRLLLAATIVLLIALVGGLLMRFLAPGFDELSESVWWAFLRLTDPGYLGDDEGLIGRSISTVVTVLGYVLFLGLLIAILTQWMNALIVRIESGASPLSIADHVLILGWTHRTPNIVLQLLRTRDRAARLLEARNAHTLRIVVLAAHVDRTLTAELKAHLGSYWNDRRVLLRSGSPLRLEHLERVCFEDAAAIILPGEDFSDRSPGVADADTLKTLASIDRHTRGEVVKPLAVAALYDPNRAGIARQTYRGETEILATDQVISRLIAQSVRQIGIWAVFSQLLSVQEGNSFFIRRLREDGMTFGKLRRECRKAIPIGVIKAGSTKPQLNPPANAPLGSDDLIVYLACSLVGCADRAPMPTEPARLTASSWNVAAQPQSLLVLGWNRRVPALMREFAADEVAIDVVGLTPIEDRALNWAGHDVPDRSNVNHIEANFLDPIRLEELQPWSYDRVILLARARMGDEAHADASTITAYLSLQALLAEHDRAPELFVELLEPENRFVFADREEVIVTPLIISFMLSQIALRRELAAVFAELSRVGGPQIVLHPMVPSDYPEAVDFAALAALAEDRGEIALGLLSADGELELNPARTARWPIQDGDRLVSLTTIGDPA